MQNDDNQREKTEAIEQLMKNVSELSNMVVDHLKINARDVVDQTIASARVRVGELVSLDEVKQRIQSRPLQSFAAAFAIGALVGLTRHPRLRAPMMSALAFGFDLIRQRATESFQQYFTHNSSSKNSTIIH